MLGIMTFSHILLRVVESSNKCLYCARSATVARNCNAFETSCNNILCRYITFYNV